MDAHVDEAGRDVLRALYAADIDYEFFDLDSGSVSRALLFFAGGSLVSSDQERRLTAFVDAGGVLVVFQPDGLGTLVGAPVAVTTAAPPQRLRLSLSDAHAVELSSPAVLVYADPPGEAILAARIAPLPPTQEGGHAHVQLPVGERLTVGYFTQRGTGRILVVGVSPTPELVLAIHSWLGVRIACRTTSNEQLHSALFRRGDEYVAILTNTALHAQDALLHLDVPAPGPRTACDLRTGLESAVTNNSVTLRVPARSGTAVRLL